jgi:hydroxymethylpyrimidine/phosphomethylpyrimidine kinase
MTNEFASKPVALTIAGSDSSAGAGVQADLKTFAALEVYGISAVTCVVAETPGLISKIEPVSAQLISAQLEVLIKGFPIGALKTGLLYSAEIISMVAKKVGAMSPESRPPLVIDPVMVATSGDQLLREGAVEIYERELFPLATLITPNLDEGAQLLGERINNLEEMRTAGQSLAKKYNVAILLKGGHLTGKIPNAIDLLFHNGKISEFSAPFSIGVTTHGTGCTYSAAITAGLACGLSIEEAIRRAKGFVTAAIAQHFRWKTPTGIRIDALNHFPSG